MWAEGKTTELQNLEKKELENLKNTKPKSSINAYNILNVNEEKHKKYRRLIKIIVRRVVLIIKIHKKLNVYFDYQKLELSSLLDKYLRS